MFQQCVCTKAELSDSRSRSVSLSNALSALAHSNSLSRSPSHVCGSVEQKFIFSLLSRFKLQSLHPPKLTRMVHISHLKLSSGVMITKFLLHFGEETFLDLNNNKMEVRIRCTLDHSFEPLSLSNGVIEFDMIGLGDAAAINMEHPVEDNDDLVNIGFSLAARSFVCAKEGYCVEKEKHPVDGRVNSLVLKHAFASTLFLCLKLDLVLMDTAKGLEASGETLEEQVKAFFYSAPPLHNSDEITQKLNQFIQRNSSPSGRRIVCVTSGGTTAPLEQRCVRYVDNFSSGHRGATSTEYFLKAGYAVIFLYRKRSFQPFCRSLPDDPLLECFKPTDESNIQVCEAYSEAVKRAIVDHHTAVAGGLLLKLPFNTIFEYLQMLQMIAMSMRTLGPRAMFYLAAAVSDFYVPWKDMVEHKIQSGSHLLDVKLVQVPKMLSVLRKDWAPQAFCISFKLETDSNILLNKAGAALEKYKMHAVVANELSTRKEQVVVVTSDEKVTVRCDKSKLHNDVEDPLIKLLSEKHATYSEQFR
ncbi:hypothetical protein VNO78_01430 [Psophocarpus tetragonolobus]|uniref:DNA/pantothenate metabolism flavoprotein C-terminal domain-containing protein n=1 Tax=Psophocarpus tetragonolobus TaxID=3891 RepID=A0AAN9SZK0_PSOTE